jgi:hypothetical protein
MTADQRTEYRSPAAGARVFFRAEPGGREEQRYLLGVAENASFGGMFIATPHPLPPGTVVKLQLHGRDRDSPGGPLCARALVRWRRVWRRPQGMGVQFVEFSGLGERSLSSWLEALLAPPPQISLPDGFPLYAPPALPPSAPRA